jgi:hypothetical protein
MRETRHEETEERPPGTSTFTRLSSRYYGPLKRDMPLSIDRCTVSLVGRLASSHGGQVSGGLALLDVKSIRKKPPLRAEVFVFED